MMRLKPMSVAQRRAIHRKIEEKRWMESGVTRPAPDIVWIDTPEEADAYVANPPANTISAPRCFQEFEETPARIKDPHGGRGSAKTATVAKLLMRRVIWFGAKLLAAREIMDSIKESSKAELEAAVRALGAEDLVRITDREIVAKSGGRVAFIGLAKTGDNIKGYADFDLFWVEEAATVSAASWRRLVPTLRKKSSELWITWNPSSTVDATWKLFVSESPYPEYDEKGAPYRMSRHINFDKNPFFHMTELVQDEQFLREADEDEHAHVYLGQPLGAIANAIIKPAWVKAAIDLHLLLNPDYDDGAHLIGGYDVGGTEKGDASSVALNLNSVLCYLNEYREIDPVASAVKAYQIAEEMDCAEVRFDTIGVGLGSKGKIREINEMRDVPIPFRPFDASAPVLRPEEFVAPRRRNKDHYMNQKAQFWDELGKRFFHAYLLRRYWAEFDGHMPSIIEKMGEERLQMLISIDSARIEPKLLEKLQGELSAPTWIMTEGKRQVETKKMLAKRGVPSTNNADAVVMAFMKLSKGYLSDAL